MMITQWLMRLINDDHPMINDINVINPMIMIN
jgi:hypothetical protein